jgi:NADH-quinone oxidoreductase subunit G
VVQAEAQDWALPVANTQLAPAADWAQALANIACAVAAEKAVSAPAAGTADAVSVAIARSLLGGERKAILLGNAAAHHARASSLLALAHWIAAQTGATVGYLTEAANTVGAQLVGALPGAGGRHAAQMLAGGVRALVLLNTEPAFDAAGGNNAANALGSAQMVVSMSPFKANLDIADVLLPIAPFTETSGSFVNAEGRIQGFHAVVKPAGDARPAWKVLRVLGNMLGVAGFDFESTPDVLRRAGLPESGLVPSERLSNQTGAVIDLAPAGPDPVVAPIYQLDSIVRRATSLQLTADARAASRQEVAA